MKHPVATLDDGFDRFWAIYPRHSSKKDAQKAWGQLKPSPDLLNVMLAALAWQVNCAQWTKDGGSFVPYAASWIRGERWMDEPLRPVKPHLGSLSSRMVALLAPTGDES